MSDWLALLVITNKNFPSKIWSRMPTAWVGATPNFTINSRNKACKQGFNYCCKYRRDKKGLYYRRVVLDHTCWWLPTYLWSINKGHLECAGYKTSRSKQPKYHEVPGKINRWPINVSQKKLIELRTHVLVIVSEYMCTRRIYIMTMSCWTNIHYTQLRILLSDVWGVGHWETLRDTGRHCETLGDTGRGLQLHHKRQTYEKWRINASPKCRLGFILKMLQSVWG